jgi:hypothetical protein
VVAPPTSRYDQLEQSFSTGQNLDLEHARGGSAEGIAGALLLQFHARNPCTDRFLNEAEFDRGNDHCRKRHHFFAANNFHLGRQP